MHDRATDAAVSIARSAERADPPITAGARPSITGVPVRPIGPRGRRCTSCGYNLHGLATAAICPECGFDPAEGTLRQALGGTNDDADAWWARAVVGGVTLLLITSYVMLGVTAYMRFRSEWAGSMPVLNFPGPKLWGSALLQRSIGSAPGEWGVAGTRFGLLGLLAIWFITSPRAADRLGESPVSLRLMTRWTSLLGVGAMLGLLLGEDGVADWGGGERDVYFMLLVALVELPATTLLYLYLRQLSLSLGDPPLRRALGILSITVPACIGAAVLIFLLGDVWKEAKHQLPQQVMVAGYGAACVAAAALATATVVRLGISLLPLAVGGAGSPVAARWGGAVLDLYRQLKQRAQSRSQSLHGWLIAAGLVGWLIASASMLEVVLRFRFRAGFGGNWPMVNVIGPKVWAVPLLMGLDSYWERLNYSTLGALGMMTCLWLVTIRRWRRESSNLPARAGESFYSLRRAARWGATALFGTAVGVVVGLGDGAAFVRTHSVYSAYTLPLTMFVEGPATLLIYLYLAALAREHGDERLARHLSWAGLLAVALILGGNGMFVLSRMGVGASGGDGGGGGGGGGAALEFLTVAAYGLACVAVGLWATWSVLRLIGRLIMPGVADEHRQLSLFEQRERRNLAI